MYETIRQATLDPDSFFEDRASEPQRSGPALIVAVLGLLYLGTGYLILTAKSS